eukprot:11042367-Karenia_brevis.AAC.1
MERALQEATHLRLEQVKEPKVVDEGIGTLHWDALPLKPLPLRAAKMKIWVERIENVDASFD